MEVKYLDSQGVDIFLSRKEFDELTKKMNEFPCDGLRASSKEAGAHFFLGYCPRTKLSDIISDPNTHYMPGHVPKLEEQNGIQLLSPSKPGDPYYINLLPEAVRYIKQDGRISLRMLGGHKLTIFLREELK